MRNFTKLFTFIICASTMLGSVYAFNNEIMGDQTVSTFIGPEEACYASNVIAFSQGKTSNGQSVTADRSDPEKALGLPDMSNAPNGFVSLGINGYIILEFPGAIFDQPGNDIMIYETSYSGDACGRSDDEMAKIELSQDGINWIYYGEICRDEAIDIAGLGLDYVTQIKITDNTTMGGDGYDVDGVVAINGCQDIPEEGCYGSEVIAGSYLPGLDKNGKPLTNPKRIDPSKALGKPQDDNTYNFVSLGYGGQITIGFDGVVYNEPGDDLMIVETSFGNPSFTTYQESADVFVTQNGIDFYFIGSVQTNQSARLDIDNAPIYLQYITQVRVVDTTPANSISLDGFDLDGIVALTGCREAEEVIYADCYATEVLEYKEGTTIKGGVIENRRTATPENVLGKPEGTDKYVFTSLGYGGHIILGFDGAVKNGPGADLVFIETSFNTVGCSAYPEYADIYVSFDGYSWHFANTICKSDNKIDISDAGDFEYINFVKVVNNDTLSKTPDGYDLDGVIALHTCLEYDDTMGIVDAINSNFELKTYPNPTSGVSKIDFQAPQNGKMLIEVYDLMGRNVSTVFDQQVNKFQNYKLNFDGSNLPNGMYIYKITLDNITSNKKFMIAH